MKKLLLIPTLLVSLLVVSCGGDNEESEGDEKSEESVNAVEKSVSAEVSSDNTDLSNINLEHITAFKYGRNINGTRNRKSYVVVMSNQEISLSDTYMYTSMPKPGQHYLIIEFMDKWTEDLEGDPSEVTAGDFEVSSMFEDGKVIDVFYNVGTDSQQEMVLKKKANPSGTAKLTRVDKGGIAGSVDIQYDGFTCQADFSAPIEKDYWKMAMEQREKMKKAMENMK